MNGIIIGSIAFAEWPAGDVPAAVAAPCEDILAAGLGWLAETLEAEVGQSITYRRGLASVALCATFGQTQVQREDGAGGIVIEATDRDFVIRSSRLRLNGIAVVPARGDVIEWNDGAGKVHSFEVGAMGASGPAWRWSDPYRRRIRIHTTYKKTEAAE
jgi:hypothetical protein